MSRQEGRPEGRPALDCIFAVSVAGPGQWTLQLRPFGPGEPLMELRFASRPDCEEAIETIREAPVRYSRGKPPVHSLAEPDAGSAG